MAQRYEEFRERSGYNDDKGERRGGGRGTHLFTLPQEVGKTPCCQSCPPVVIADERTEGFLLGSASYAEFVSLARKEEPNSAKIADTFQVDAIVWVNVT